MSCPLPSNKWQRPFVSYEWVKREDILVNQRVMIDISIIEPIMIRPVAAIVRAMKLLLALLKMRVAFILSK